MRGGAQPTARHVEVAASIVNNRPETMERSRRSFPTAAGWCVALMKDRRPGRRQRSGRRAGTHNQRPWLWVPAFEGTTPVEFVGVVSPKCAALALRLTMSNRPSRSRGAFSAPGVLHRCFAHPERGWAERRETFGCSAEHPCGMPSCVKDARERAYDAARQALARRLASHDAGRSPLGAPPWRFWAPGAALPSPWAPAVLQRRAVALRIRAASSSHPGRSAWRAGSLPPGANGYESPPRDATPRSTFRIVSRTRPQ
jgi:hypothetical protein